MNSAAIFNITDIGNGQGYSIKQLDQGKFVSVLDTIEGVLLGSKFVTFNVFSVTKATDSGTGF